VEVLVVLICGLTLKSHSGRDDCSMTATLPATGTTTGTIDPVRVLADTAALTIARRRAATSRRSRRGNHPTRRAAQRGGAAHRPPQGQTHRKVRIMVWSLPRLPKGVLMRPNVVYLFEFVQYR